MSKWKELISDFEDDEGTVHIDGYLTYDSMEAGKTIVKIRESGEIEYVDPDARTDEKVQELIKCIQLVQE